MLHAKTNGTGLAVFSTEPFLGLEVVFLVFPGFWCRVARGGTEVHSCMKMYSHILERSILIRNEG
jgi:hypothetical protein